MLLTVFVIAIAISVQGCLALPAPNPCTSGQTPAFPPTHIYHTKDKPLLFGHRGNPRKFQENSLAGFQSLRSKKGRDGCTADGFETDVFLTKDKKLVCFHDVNAFRLTGVNRSISDMTEAEIRNIRFNRKLTYGGRVHDFGRRRPLVFLPELLAWAKTTDLLVYIELKPSDILLTPAARVISMQTGQIVASMVQSLGMKDKVVLNSYDLVKLGTAKVVVPSVVIGTSYTSQFWEQPSLVYPLLKGQLMQSFPAMASCLAPVTADRNFVTHLFNSGILEKTMQASFSDIDKLVYDNATYGQTPNQKTLQLLRQNYGPNMVLGAYTVYSMNESKRTHMQYRCKIDSLIRQGLDMVMTDDVGRVARDIDRIGREDRRSDPSMDEKNDEERVENAEEDERDEEEEEDDDV